MATGFDYEPKLVLRKYSLCTKAMIKADISAIMSSSYKEWIGLFQLLPEWICPLLGQVLEAIRIVISVNWRKSKTAYGGLYKKSVYWARFSSPCGLVVFSQQKLSKIPIAFVMGITQKIFYEGVFIMSKRKTTEPAIKEETTSIAEVSGNPVADPAVTPSDAPIVNTDEASAKAFLATYDISGLPKDNREALVWLAQGISDGILAYNAIQGTDVSVSVSNEVDNRLNDLRGKYNGVSKAIYIEDIRQIADPLKAMMTAIHNPFYETISIVDIPVEGQLSKRESRSAKKRIGLLDLDKKIKNIGKNSTWTSKLNKAWLMFLSRGIIEAVETDVKPDNIEAARKADWAQGMSDDDIKREIVARRYETALAKMESNTSNRIITQYRAGNFVLDNSSLEKILKDLFVDMIDLGESNKQYSPKMADVRHIKQLFFKAGKVENQVKHCKENQFANLIMDVLRCRVEGVEYSFDIKL